MLIAFEGIDGSGKTSVSEGTYQLLRRRDDRFRYCSKRPELPNALARAQLNRHANATWHPKILSQSKNPFCDDYWILLLAAWYVGLEQHVFRPMIDEGGYHVVLEKWFRSMVAKLTVQGGDSDWLNALFRPVRVPDLVVLLDVDPAVTRTRREEYRPTENGSWATGGVKDDLEVRFQEYQSAVRQELLLAAKNEDWMVIEYRDGLTIDDLVNEIADDVTART